MGTSGVLNLLVEAHLLRSTDRRIAPAVTTLYRRASQDAAQPMRRSVTSAPLLPHPTSSSLPHNLSCANPYTETQWDRQGGYLEFGSSNGRLFGGITLIVQSIRGHQQCTVRIGRCFHSEHYVGSSSRWCFTSQCIKKHWIFNTDSSDQTASKCLESSSSQQ